MRIKLLAVFVFFIGFSIQSAYGQWDAQVSQYWQTKTYFNPSFVGEANNIDISMLHRIQWVGVDNAPKTSILTANMPFEFLGKTHGVGVQMFNEDIGLFSNLSTTLQYAYKFKFKNNKYLSVGLQASMTNIEFDASEIRIPNSDYHNSIGQDLPTGGEDKTYDMGLGVAWIAPSYYVGLSMTHLWEPKFEVDDKHSGYLARSYYLVAGYNIKINNSLFVLQPSALVKSDAVTTQVDVTARVEYNEMFNGGFSWRKDDGFVFLLGAKIKNVTAGYAYDLSTSEIARASSGSHEIFVRYSIPLKKKKVEGRHKSIRIL